MPKIYLQYAMEDSTTWAGNFRDLSASLLRLATLADGGRIDQANVERNWNDCVHANINLGIVQGSQCKTML